MKRFKILLLSLFFYGFIVAQDSTLYYMDDSLYSKIIYNGYYHDYFDNSTNYATVKYLKYRIEYYRADTIYQITVLEKNARFNYWKENGKWILWSEVITYDGTKLPFWRGRCEALTTKFTRCKREGSPFCWQHK